jgi:hypothetical protein
LIDWYVENVRANDLDPQIGKLDLNVL